MSPQARKPRPRDRAPAIVEVKVGDPKLVTLHRLIEQRRRVTSKLKALPGLEPRQKIENPGSSLKLLAERLQAKKAAIDEAMAKLGRGAPSSVRPPPRRRQVQFARERLALTLEEVLEAQGAQLGGRFRQQAPCPTVYGTASPVLTGVGATVPGLNDLHHGSTSDYAVDRQSYFMGCLYYLAGAWLNDKASIWRDDNPDSAMWYDSVCIDLPALECDANVTAAFSIRFSGNIGSEADDHNEIRQYVYVAHSDEDGVLPPYVSFGDEYGLNSLDLSGEIGLPMGNRFDSGYVTASLGFRARAGVAPRVAIANCTELAAQDGTLSIVGTWEVTQLSFSIAPV